MAVPLTNGPPPRVADARVDHVSAGISEDEDVEVPAPTRSAPVVFASMQEVEAFWDQQAHYVSSVCSVDVPLARSLLREHHHDVDAAIQGFLMNVCFRLLLEAHCLRMHCRSSCCACLVCTVRVRHEMSRRANAFDTAGPLQVQWCAEESESRVTRWGRRKRSVQVLRVLPVIPAVAGQRDFALWSCQHVRALLGHVCDGAA